MKYILIGAGSRGMTYGAWAAEHGIEIAAVAEKRPDRLADAGQKLKVPENMRFSDGLALLSLGKIADAAIIATMDRDHFAHTMAALDCGYDILLEKPISPDPRECVAIEEKANTLGRRITVCHVLRYTNFFGTLKQILDGGELGKIVAIKHSENIGNYHMAHSFVRGNWRNDRLSSPIILQKSCHDLDILLWLTGSHCTKVSAFGGLRFFRPENAPQGAGERCCDCPAADTCRFNAYRVYTPLLGQWPADVVCLEQTPEALEKALRSGPYGRCVYRCDNNVCDHMSMILEFENGVTATFSLTAQTNAVHRNLHIMCENGEIEADDGKRQIVVTKFAASPAESLIPGLSTSAPVPAAMAGEMPGLWKILPKDFKTRTGNPAAPFPAVWRAISWPALWSSPVLRERRWIWQSSGRLFWNKNSVPPLRVNRAGVCGV